MYEKHERLTFSFRYCSLRSNLIPPVLAEKNTRPIFRKARTQSTENIGDWSWLHWVWHVSGWEVYLSCEIRKYSHLPMHRFRVRIHSYDSTTLCFQCYLFQKNRSNSDIISTAVPRNPWFPENIIERSLVNMQNKKRHVVILFLKNIKTGQSSKNNFNLGFIHLDDDI